jgi:hypothetical protein
MKVETAVERLKSALHSALWSNERTSVAQLAQNFLESETELIAELTPQWQLQEVTRLLRRKRRELARANREKQMVFPAFEKEFALIPRRVPVDAETRVPLDDLTLKAARKYLAGFKQTQRDNPKLLQAQRIVELLYKHSRTQKGITWAEVKAIEGPKAKSTT